MSILSKKNEISEKYLGKGGVHGVGMSRERGVIMLHVETPADDKQQRDLEKLIERAKKDAAPYEVTTDLEERATASGLDK